MANKKIKILYTIPNFDTAGSGKVVYDLVKHIDKKRFEPQIACFHKKGAFFIEIEKLGVPIHIVPFAISYRPIFSFPFRLVGIIRFFRKHQFDVIHSWHWSSDFSEPLAARLSGIPFIYTKKSMGWGNRAWDWRSSLSSSIVAINRDMMLLLNRHRLKVSQLSLGVNLDYYKPQVKSLAALQGVSSLEGSFIIISVVNLISVKGIEVLIKAVQLLEGLKIKLCIVGDDSSGYAQQLKNMVSGSNNIHFFGKQLDVRPFHAMADLFVIPTLSLGEGFPMAPVEAMASGRIVIGSDVPGVRDVLRGFPDCLFESDHVESLKNKIMYIANMSINDRMLLEKAMRTFVERNFSLKGFISSRETLYKEIVQ